MKRYLLITIAVGVLFVMAGLIIVQEQRCLRLERTMEELALGAFHQTVEDMDRLSLDLEKTLLAGDPALSASLLSNVTRTAEDVQQSLSVLPADQQAMQPLLGFAGQLSQDAAALLTRVVAQGSLSPADTALLTRQLALCSQLCSQLAMADQPADLASITLEGTAPVQPNATVTALPDGDITQEEALEIARRFVGDERVLALQAAPGTTGTLAAYGVTVTTPDVQLNLEITRQGGKVLWMIPETASFPVVQSVSACQQAAEALLDTQGFGPMQAVAHQIYDGLCVITFVPTQEGVLLYPDLIRVQLRMDTAQVVGLEAHSYWLHHLPRKLPAPAVSAEEASAHLAGHAQVDAARLCLITHDGQEVLCHEFTLRYGGESFLLYVDAQTGRELHVLKVIHTENGLLTA